jgi:hypothetical protein
LASGLLTAVVVHFQVLGKEFGVKPVKSHYLIRLVICAGLLSAAHPQPAWSWGDTGHGAVGYIAQQNLSPKGKALIFRIVGAEPLPVSAVFPDHVRSDERFKNYAPFHFFEISPGHTFQTLPENERAEHDAHSIIARAGEVLTRSDISREQKMTYLRYLVHVVGDVHQPLHVGNGVDRGANLCDVNWTSPVSGDSGVTNLHTAWDESLIQNIADDYRKTSGKSATGKYWFGYKELADLALAEFTSKTSPDEASALSKAPAGTWYDESSQLHSLVYPDDVQGTKPDERVYCKIVDKKTNKVVNGKYDKSKLPTLDEAYIQKALPVIKRQIVLGGLRLAELINSIAEKDTALQPLIGEEKAQLDQLRALLSNTGAGRLPQNKDSKKTVERKSISDWCEDHP